jgi:[protein-PII] uridylyltransferase
MTGAKQRSKEEAEVWRRLFLETGQPAAVLKSRTAQVDALVAEAWAAALSPAFADGLALLAVGGYGRKELFPFSDVDLLLLTRRPIESMEARGALSEFLRLLWDAGLRVSQSVRTLEECASVTEGNFELTVSLLDHRLLTGDRELFAAMAERFRRFLAADSRDLVKRLCRMSRARHARFHNTIYRLEPDVKETPGGLRDLQTVHWLNILRGMQREEPADPRSQELLHQVRCFLHFEVARDANLLSFEMQDLLAAAKFSPWPDPAEWMRAYYRAASVIYREALLHLEAGESQDRGLLANFRDWRSRLSNSDFTVSRDLVFLKRPHDLDTGPALAERLFLFVARHGVGPARQTEDRVAAHLAGWAPGLLRTPPQASFWQELLALPAATTALRVMRDTGFLAAVLPEWARIDHLVVRDYYHQYTVDEHTLVALEALEGLEDPKAGGDKRLKQVAEEHAHMLWLTRLALLLHDIGKGLGGEHTQQALRLAEPFLRRIGAGDDEHDTILFLIRHHLTLSQAMQTKDLADPATAAQLAAVVHTVERLSLLTLMTYADISGVNPTAMSEWRLEQLWHLFRTVSRHLTGELTGPRSEDPHSVYGPLEPALESFLKGLPSRYLWTHSRDAAAAHAALHGKAAETGAALAVERREGVWRVSVVTEDRPFLFASLAGALSSFGLNILQAEAFSNAGGFIVDGFVFVDPSHSLDLNPPEVERLKSVLRKVALGQVRAEDLLKHRPVRPAPGRHGAVRQSVTPDNEASPVATVFEVVAHDRPGLLYSLASAISRFGCNIEVVLVNTEAHKAIDVFHVTGDGRKLEPEAAAELRQALEAAC